MSKGDTFIELKDIVKLFPGVRALDGVSFDIREGEVHSPVSYTHLDVYKRQDDGRPIMRERAQ